MISNIRKYNRTSEDIKADSDYNKYIYVRKTLSEIASNETLSNYVTSMENRLNKLCSSGRIKDESQIDYIICKSSIDNIIKVMQKPVTQRNAEDIFFACEAYNDFNNTFTKYMGGNQ